MIGGVAMQLYSQEPRTTLDIDLAVPKYDQIPSSALMKAGFVHEGRHPHSDNWRAPGGAPREQRTAIQFYSEDIEIELARQDLLDVITLAEGHPSEAMAVPQLRQRVDRLSSSLLTLGLTRGPKP